MPEERVSRLVMGILHISQWVREELGERIEKLILSGDEHIQEKGKGKGKFTWVFGDGLSETLDGEKIIFGRLGKMKREFTIGANICETSH